MQPPKVGSDEYILPLTNLVVSFERAVELRNAGYPQNSYFYWIDYGVGQPPSLLSGHRFPELEGVKHYAAYLETELKRVVGE